MFKKLVTKVKGIKIFKRKRIKYAVKGQEKPKDTEKKRETSIEDKYYWVRAITGAVAGIGGVLIGLVGWWMLLFMIGFLVVWPFFQSFVIFRLPYKKGKWDWKNILKTGIGAYFFIFMLTSTLTFTLMTYNQYKVYFTHPADTRDIFIEGKIAYVADGQNGLLCLNISDPNHRSLIGEYNEIKGATAELVEYIDGIVYLTTGIHELYLLNVSQPDHPRLLSSLSLPGSISQIDLVNGHLFCAGGDKGIYIVDISDIQTPFLSKTYSNYTINGFVFRDEILYCATGDTGLQLLNISSINEIEIIGNCNTSSLAQNVAVNDEFAYIMTTGQGILSINITNTTSPQFVSSLNTTGRPTQMVFINQTALIIDTQEGIVFTDLLNAGANLNITSKYKTLGARYNFDWEGNYLYVADGSRGISVVYIPNPGPSPSTTTTNRTVSFGWMWFPLTGIAVISIIVFIVKRRPK